MEKRVKSVFKNIHKTAAQVLEAANVLFLTTVAALSLTACGEKPVSEPVSSQVQLEVVTTFAGDDTNARNYKAACDEWEAESGNIAVDLSAQSSEVFKNRVVMSFETNSEPDVLFFFNGADADSFILSGGVVSIDEIREEYPDYAANVDEERLVASSADGKKYAVPVNGFWEAMFVNKDILAAAGVDMPGADYTWEQFEKDCARIKEAGYVPIAAALGDIPHYWWEYCIFNHTGMEDHLIVPESVETGLGRAWVAGISDIKALYEAGFFPPDTLSATNDDTFAMFMDGKAAFLIDGSWKVGSIVQACCADAQDESTLDEAALSKFGVTYVPGTDKRKASDLVGGLSMGYYITRKAWEDPAKREAAVDFVSYMSSDEVAPRFSQHTVSALKKVTEPDTSRFNSLQIECMEMIEGADSLTLALQDVFSGPCRTSTFEGMKDIVSGKVTPEEAVEEGLASYHSAGK